MNVIEIMALFFAIVIGLYAILLFFYSLGWIVLKPYKTSVKPPSTSIAIVIAARNEEKNIAACLEHIVLQNYPVSLFSVVVVNDASSDSTGQIVLDVKKKYPQLSIELLELTEAMSASKKKALTEGIRIAKGELIVTTDADCIMGPLWLKTLEDFYRDTGAMMIMAPVSFHLEKGMIEQMQSLEFTGLMGITGASSHWGHPIMCNGANLAYTRKAFDELGGFDGIDSLASGDDVLWMLKLNRKYPGAARFVKSKEAMVYTKAQSAWTELLQQRKRWASKLRKAKDGASMAVGILVFLAHFVSLLSLMLAVVYPSFMTLFLSLVGIKCIFEFLFLLLTSSYFNKGRFLIWFLPLQLIYPGYVVYISLVANLGKFKWKDRYLK